jgi:hypothetical protein
MDQIMNILHIEKKGPKLQYSRKIPYIYDMTKRGLQMNGTFTDMHNPIFDTLIIIIIIIIIKKKQITLLPPPPPPPPPIALTSHHPKPIDHTVYIHTRAPQ